MFWLNSVVSIKLLTITPKDLFFFFYLKTFISLFAKKPIQLYVPIWKDIFNKIYCIKIRCYFQTCVLYKCGSSFFSFFFLGQIPDGVRARVPFDLQTFRFPALRFSLRVYFVLLRHTNTHTYSHTFTLHNIGFYFYINHTYTGTRVVFHMEITKMFLTYTMFLFHFLFN